MLFRSPCIFKLSMLLFCYMYIKTFCILYYHSHGDSILKHMGDSILKITVSTFSKWPPGRFCVQYYNMASFPVWLQIKHGWMLLFLDRLQIFFEQLYFRLFKLIDQWGCLSLLKTNTYQMIWKYSEHVPFL